MASQPSYSLHGVRHPDYLTHLTDWQTWRDVWEGGDNFVHKYLQQWSERESSLDFSRRKAITPVPGFAKTALVDIKNAIFHRMGDIIRRGGTSRYTEAMMGAGSGVDRRGSSMNHYLGSMILPELLLMGRVGVFVDNLRTPGPTLADAQGASPYLYTYPVEDICNWKSALPEDVSEFQAIVLRDWCMDYTEDSWFGIRMPKGRFDRYRMLWIDPADKYVRYQFFNKDQSPITPDGTPSELNPVRLDIKEIPFVSFDIGGSLLQDIAKHQIALLNMCSSDVSYALKANFPFYTEQQDRRAFGSHLKTDVGADGTATSGGQASGDTRIKVGTIDGRAYGLNTDRPGFIHPSSEPLKASMALQDKLENDIRKLVNLAIVALGNNAASAESRNFDNQGLESGLAFIGQVLENGERKIAKYWNAYESSKTAVVVKYPEQYSLRSQADRIKEADELTSLMFSIPGNTVKKELAKDAVYSLLGGRVSLEKMAKINTEIDNSRYSTSDPNVVQLAKEQGLASDITLSNALGFDGEKEIEQANKDHAARIKRIQVSQTQGIGGSLNPETDPAEPQPLGGARGLKDLAVEGDAKQEKAESQSTLLQDSTKKRTRGRGKQGSD